MVFMPTRYMGKVGAIKRAHTIGNPAGYKVALTSRPAQARFGVDRPLTGVLLERMLLDDGAGIAVASGVRLMGEADLLVRVGRDAIDTADSRREILAALSEAIPFLEVPDLVYAEDARPDGPALTAINAGARHGVLGVALAATDEWEQRLAEFRVLLRDGAGTSWPRAAASTCWATRGMWCAGCATS